MHGDHSTIPGYPQQPYRGSYRKSKTEKRLYIERDPSNHPNHPISRHPVIPSHPIRLVVEEEASNLPRVTATASSVEAVLGRSRGSRRGGGRSGLARALSSLDDLNDGFGGSLGEFLLTLPGVTTAASSVEAVLRGGSSSSGGGSGGSLSRSLGSGSGDGEAGKSKEGEELHG